MRNSHFCQCQFYNSFPQSISLTFNKNIKFIIIIT